VLLMLIYQHLKHSNQNLILKNYHPREDFQMSSGTKSDKIQKLPVHYSLSFKFAITLTALVATLLITYAIVVTYTRIGDVEKDIDNHATSFAQLSTATIGEAYLKYSSTEAYKFRDLVSSQRKKTQDVDQIELIDPEGKILFDLNNQQLDGSFKSPQGSGQVVKSDVKEIVRRLQFSKQEERDKSDNLVLTIVDPYIDTTGHIPFLIRYVISYESLRKEMVNSALQMTIITIIGILVSIGVAVFIARRITQPIDQMILGTSAIAQGNYDQKLNIQTKDELEDLARNFNFMAEQLKINIFKLEDSKVKVQDTNIKLEQSNARLASTNKQLEDSQAKLQYSNQQLESSNKELAKTNKKLEVINDQLENTIEQLAKANKQLEQANEELKQLDRMKSEFLQTLSHELRTPLSAIKGYNEYLLEQMVGPINIGQKRALQTMQRNIDRLTTYINALLDFSRIEAGTIPVSIQPFKLVKALDQTLLVQKATIEKKDISLNIEGIDSLPLVLGDRDRITQVFDNLLSNAIKFTNEGGEINIIGKLLDKKVEISISDNGVGITRNKIDKIFDRFYQCDSSTTRQYGGIGLGLSFVKNIIDAHKTTIKVESQENIGSTFTFTLNLANTLEFSENGTVPLIDNRKSYLIEIIDDEPDINDMLKISLIKEGYNVIDASNGEEGLRIARHHLPDLIILDVKLPDINGFEVLSCLKQEEKTKDIPVIIMSILNDPEESIKMGAIDHIIKPVDLKYLKAKINRSLATNNPGVSIKPTVMVVDDESDVRKMICDRLTIEGFNTLSASDGDTAFAILKREPIRPDLILLDIMMPNQSGWDVMTVLKSDPLTARIPIILVSAKGEEEDIRKGYELGAKDYIVKPFEMKDLMVEVKSVVAINK
jgi:signal transduction histidine kinase/DNA-binding response OmpR family regulator/HAMP domain-containing protein